MKKSRLEAFSDGVIAIINTIMVLELKVPHGATLAALQPLWPVLACYLGSFIYVGSWQVVEQVNGRVLWADLHPLFWLSLLVATSVRWCRPGRRCAPCPPRS